MAMAPQNDEELEKRFEEWLKVSKSFVSLYADPSCSFCTARSFRCLNPFATSQKMLHPWMITKAFVNSHCIWRHFANYSWITMPSVHKSFNFNCYNERLTYRAISVSLFCSMRTVCTFVQVIRSVISSF